MNNSKESFAARLVAVFLAFATVAFGVAAAAAQSMQSVRIGAGDVVRIEVFGSPDLTTTSAVAEDGTVRMPLAGSVMVGSLSPPEAARRVEDALRTGQYLVNPQATVTVVQSVSQRVSVLGEVATPGRYPIDGTTTVLDAVALAGGVTPKGFYRVQVLRRADSGAMERIVIDLRQIGATTSSSDIRLRGGDSIVVPKGTFFITGQVMQPGEYQIEGDMLLFEAIARAGGVTPTGSASRVEIRRRGENDEMSKVDVKKSTRVEPGDVIRVKERLF